MGKLNHIFQITKEHKCTLDGTDLVIDRPNLTARVKLDRLGRYPLIPSRVELIEKNVQAVDHSRFSLLVDQDDLKTI